MERVERLDPVLVGGVALVVGGLAAVGPGPLVGAAAAILALGWVASRVRGATIVVAAVALAIGAARANAAVRRHEAARTEADASLPRPARCGARGTVASSPVAVRGTLRWDADLEGLVCDGEPVTWSGRATLYGGPPELARGDAIEVVATLAPPQRMWNPSTGDPRASEALRGALRTGGALDVRIERRAWGIVASIDRLRARVRRRIEATFDPDLAPMARALVLGESDLAPADDQAFRASGLSHLLAVSGMHLVLVLALALRSLEGVFCRVEALAARFDGGRFAAALGIPIAWLYAEFAGAGGSTLRAAWMASVALAARALGRRSDATRAFGLSLGAMAAAQPLVAFDLSFALSAGATAGLLVFGRPLGDALASRVPARLASPARAVGTTLAASVPCAPILARFAPTVPLGGVVANLVAVPLGESAALPICLVHACVAAWPAAEAGCAAVASGALALVRMIARASALPALTAQVPPPTPWQMAVLAALLAALALRPPRRAAWIAAGVAALTALEIQARRAGTPHGVLRVTFLDVGQGDAALVDLPDGQAVVVDGGGLVGSPIDVGQSVLAPELRARRRGAIAFAVLTHPHPDHFGGLLTGLETTSVGALWDTGQGEAEQTGGGYAALLTAMRARGVPVLRPDVLCGTRSVGGATLEVLAPCPGPTSDRNPNDNSFVIRVTFQQRSILLVGDAEREEEGDLLARHGESLRADVLKVGHHGSATSSTPAFLAAVQASNAVVSAGRRNRFGHPHPRTLEDLAAAGATTWRTDVEGAIVATTDGRGLALESASGARP
ncbi:MAG TPA: DNA internalization-related competence protein ComEC/Rec2 [Polyangiaceae bacterium]|nr:DNA internalization-related competence protein ComEC/Rec2 [Polyangiaceae bacterium]